MAKMIYIVRDRDTHGVDFLMWGTDYEAAQVTLADCIADDLDVELVGMPADKLDTHTRRLIGPIEDWRIPTITS